MPASPSGIARNDKDGRTFGTTPAIGAYEGLIAPVIGSITPSSTQLTVAFTAGSNGGYAITNYKYSTDGGNSFYSSNTSSSPIVISTLSSDGTTALTTGTTYNIQIKAVNANGDGLATASTAATPIFTAPTATAATAVTSTGFTANWTAASQGPSATYTFTLQYGTVADLSSGTTSISSISSSTLSQAVNCFAATTYYYRVMVTNGTTSSAWSSIQTLTTTGTRTYWSQDLTGLKLGDSPVSLSATTSAVTNPSTITYESSNTSVVSVSGSTLTVVGPGTATVTAHQPANAYNEAAADVTQNATVSINNSSFEDATNTASNSLVRVSNFFDLTPQSANPAPGLITTITANMWTKKAINTAYVDGLISTNAKYSGNNGLNFIITPGTSTIGFLNWSNNFIFQKLSLTNTNKYTVSFWAKVDPTASNVASSVTALITDNTKRTYLSCAIPLTGGTTWTQYSATFDIPAFKAANATADFTTAFVGVGLTSTYNASTFKTNYSGVYLDDFSVTPTTASTVVISTSGNNGSVTGGAAYTVGNSATVVAAYNSGYKFVNWTENGSEVSTSAAYTFTVASARTLVANFVATTVSVSQTTLSGFNYFNGAGPSAEQSFTVSGTNLTSNIVLTAPTNYQISTSSGTGFGTSITLTPTNAIVSTTPIYVRLKSGLAVNSYNAENISVAAYGMTNQNIACSGNVTTNPNLTFATPTSMSKTYGDAVFTNAATSTAGSAGAVTYGSGNTGVATVNASTGEITIVSAGSAVITATIAANGTYGAASTTYTLTVAPKALTITANNVNKTYGDVLTGGAGSTAFTSSGLANSETIGTVTITYGTGAAANAAVNTYSSSAVVPSAATGGNFTASNYTITYNHGNIIVGTKALTITADNQSVPYGTAASAVTGGGTYAATGFVNSETASVISGSATYSTTYTNITAAATSGVTITPIVTGLSATNYSFTPADGTITINKASSSISVTGSTSFTYSGLAQGPATSSVTGSDGAVTYSYAGVNGTTYGSSATKPTAAGSYTVTASVASNTNYNVASSSATAFTIDVATPTVTPTVGTYTYIGSAQGPTAATNNGTGTSYTFSYVGVSGTSYSASSTRPTAAGSYEVTATVAADGNYAQASSSATAFTIDKAAQTITFGALPTSKKVGDADFDPIATSETSGTNAITYSSSNTAVATIVSGNIHLVGAGTCTIYADQAASTNYNAASQVNQSLTVTAATSTVDVSTNKSSSALGLATTSEVTVTGTAVLTVNTASEVKSLATSTGTQVVVSSPLVVNTGGINLAANSTLSMADNVTVTGGVTVGSGATLKFTDAKTLNVTGDLVLKSTDTNSESTSFNANIGGGTLAVTGDIKYLKTIDDTKWYFISFPSDVTIANITGSPALGTLGTNWFIMYYDGAQRGTSGTTLTNWKTITSIMAATTYPKLNQYQGYIIGLLSGSSEITFTLDKTVLSTETTRNIPVAANNAGAISATNHGWNLIGQPYLSKYATNTGSDMTNIYKFNGSTYTDYHNDAYVQNLPIIAPFGAYFTKVTAGGSLSFGLGSRQGVRSSVSTTLADVVFLDCTTATGIDRTNIIMDDTQSASYQNGVDYEKMITTETAIPQVYTVLGGLNYSYNVLPTSSVVNLPLAIYTQTAGSTTISVDASKASSLSKLLLTDNGVSPATVTDLLTSNYTFTASAGTNNTRFAITAQRVATENNVMDTDVDAPKLSIINYQLSINNLAGNETVRVYDALGRMVISKNAISNVMEIKLNARGIYTVQLQSGTSISTRKVIF